MTPPPAGAAPLAPTRHMLATRGRLAPPPDQGVSVPDGLVELGEHPVVDAGEPAWGEGLLEEAADAARAVPGGLHGHDAAVGALRGDGPGGHHAGVRVRLHDLVL